MGLDRDADFGLRMMKEEFEDHPEAVALFKSDYFSLLSREASDDARNRPRQQLDQIVRQPKASDEDLSLARMYEERTFKDTARANALKAQLQNSYPHGDWVKTDIFNSYYKQTDLTKKEAIYEELALIGV